jgi:S-adenosylmethionine decarboxylase
VSFSPAVGLHMIADLAGGVGLGDAGLIEAILREAAAAAGATVVGLNLHHFGPEMGVTGVALLAESHISIHTWPEEGLSAVDIFLCGAGGKPQAALAVIVARLGAQVRFEQVIPRLGRRVIAVS